MSDKGDKFQSALIGKNVPTLTLDNKWHKLVSEVGKTKEMEKLEQRLNELVKEQGRITNELKDLKKIKNNLMDEIVTNMDGADARSGDSAAEKKLADNKRLINEINDKIDKYNDDMMDLPKEIQEVNTNLMLLTMEESYDVIRDNTKDIEEIGGWIKSMRMELKKNILKKQHMELVNVQLYSYMQGIFGPDVLDLFDINYDIEATRQALIAKREAMKEEKIRNEAKEKEKEQSLKEAKGQE
ncbi:MAG: hypothetical protein K6A90_07835 [Lachnospiraceae bacterium]|nr:hypothetical protein [Lachnospiraceae bacterium]